MARMFTEIGTIKLYNFPFGGDLFLSFQLGHLFIKKHDFHRMLPRTLETHR